MFNCILGSLCLGSLSHDSSLMCSSLYYKLYDNKIESFFTFQYNIFYLDKNNWVIDTNLEDSSWYSSFEEKLSHGKFCFVLGKSIIWTKPQ